MKINVCGDLFDEEIIAFVRKLKKKTEGYKLDNGKGKIGAGKEYVLQLKNGYFVSPKTMLSSIFLTKEEGESVVR
jgi:hypothetical protein